ncbi:MAG: NCS2 family permease [Acidobacteriota bacterium]
MLEKLFKLRENRTTVKTEMLAGATTFATMAYIIFVQPVVLGAAGMDAGAVFTSTCIITALSTLLIALLANYPVAVAPAMGHNFFFAYVVVIALGISWQKALGAIFISGIIFILASAFRFREKLIAAVPESLKSSIAAGIGLFITLIGMEWAGLVRLHSETLVSLGDLKSPAAMVAIVGILATAIMLARKIKGAILFGIVIAALVAIPLGVLKMPASVVSLPPSLAPTLFKLDIWGALRENLFAIIFVFFFLDLFDTVGSLIGLAKQSGLMREGQMPRMGRALLADAIGTTGAAVVGNTTMVSYIESAAGIAAGGRTGLTGLVIAGLFFAAMFFSPLVSAISGGYPITESVLIGGASVTRRFTLYPITASALIVVGSFMMRNVRDIDWDDFTESLPAFLTMAMIPLTFSITDGIAFGFIAYALLKLVSGRWREAHWLVYLFAFLFVLRYAVPGLH